MKHSEEYKINDDVFGYATFYTKYAVNEGVKIETIAQIVKKSSVLKEKIRTEAVDLRMVKKENEQDITDFSK